jgi:hypothetical protein
MQSKVKALSQSSATIISSIVYHAQFVEQLDITENSLFFGKKSMRFKSGDPLDIFLYKTAILDVKIF